MGLPVRNHDAPIDNNLLCRPGIQRCDIAGLQPRAAPRIEHFLAASREGHQLFAGNPARLEIAMLEYRTSLVSQLLHAHPEARHRNRIEQGIEAPQLVVAQCAPGSVGQLRDIGNDRMEVGIGLLIAVGIVLEQGDRVGVLVPVERIQEARAFFGDILGNVYAIDARSGGSPRQRRCR